MKEVIRTALVLSAAIFALTIFICGCKAGIVQHSVTDSSQKYISQKTDETSLISENDFIGECRLCKYDNGAEPFKKYDMEAE